MAGDDDREFLDFFADEFWSLRRIGFLLTGDWGDAEELAQEAMARTFAAWPRVRGYDRPAAFARQLGVPAGTVKSLVHRGLARLRARLGAEYADERLTSNTEAEA